MRSVGLLIASLIAVGCASSSGAPSRALNLELRELPLFYTVRVDEPYRYAIETAVWPDGQVLRLRSQTRLVNSYDLGQLDSASLTATVELLKESWPAFELNRDRLFLDTSTRTVHLNLEGRTLWATWHFSEFPDKTVAGRVIDTIFQLELANVSRVKLTSVEYPRRWVKAD
jgi:hypothetical protein